MCPGCFSENPLSTDTPDNTDTSACPFGVRINLVPLYYHLHLLASGIVFIAKSAGILRLKTGVGANIS